MMSNIYDCKESLSGVHDSLPRVYLFRETVAAGLILRREHFSWKLSHRYQKTLTFVLYRVVGVFAIRLFEHNSCHIYLGRYDGQGWTKLDTAVVSFYSHVACLLDICTKTEHAPMTNEYGVGLMQVETK